MKTRTLKAFTLTELMVVLLIIGILVLLALPSLQSLFGEAHSIEAQQQLKHLHNLQKMEYQKRFAYSTDFKKIGFDAPLLLSEGGNAKYRYTVEATKNTFIAKATATEDFDNDGIYNVWVISEKGTPEELIED